MTACPLTDAFFITTALLLSKHHIVQVLPGKGAHLDAYYSYDPATLPLDSMLNCE